MKKGLVLIFTGDGKGKTTAALGTALRMIGCGGRVAMVVFFKNTYPGGDSHFFKKSDCPRFRVWSFGGGFTWNTARTVNQKAVNAAWKVAQGLLRDPKYRLVILDEIVIALKYKFLRMVPVIKALKTRSEKQHVILTGRGAPASLIRFADLVTEMHPLKHPFQKGIPAQPGLDF